MASAAGWTASRRRRECLTAILPLVALVVAGGVFLRLARDDGLPPALAAHAALMLASWSVLLPAGALLARYGKVTADQDFPREADNPFWWNWHRGLQYVGTALATAAFALVLSQTGGRFATWHGLLGLLVLVLGWGQVLAGWLRGSKGGPSDDTADPDHPESWRGDHFDMTLRRRLFERWHKTAGWACLALAAVVALLGAELIGAPGWLLAALGILQGAALLAILDGVVRRRWIDTYAALWGRLRSDRAPGLPAETSTLETNRKDASA